MISSLLLACIRAAPIFTMVENRSSAPVEANSSSTGTRILIIGDSWGTISPATSHFEKELNEHSCKWDGFKNIAIGGTTARYWSTDYKLRDVKTHAKDADLIWITLMGNDAKDEVPACARQGKTAVECGNEMMQSVLGRMHKILGAVHEANPDAKVVGFGYDIMFGGLGCDLMTKEMFPQCWHNASEPSPIRCFNTELVRIQEAWETLAATYPFVTAINLLGTTQVAGGDPLAAIGKPNMDKYGPAKYWPDYIECIHPGILGGDNSGAMVIMKEFYNQYWSKALNC